jgi:hypothetical protein
MDTVDPAITLNHHPARNHGSRRSPDEGRAPLRRELNPKLFPARSPETLGEGMMTNTPYQASPRTRTNSGAKK